jgi:hypothetical protein
MATTPPGKQGHPNNLLYVGYDPDTHDAAAPNVQGGLLQIASFVYNSSTGQWQPAGPQQADTQFSYLNWVATANGTGYSTGDYLQQIDEYDVSVAPAVFLGTTWRNVSQSTTLTTPPTPGTVTPVDNTIKNVYVTNFPAVQAISATALPLPAGASTSALQTTANSTLSSINSGIAALGGTQLAVTSGQKKIAVTGTAVQLGTGALVNGVVITANLNNSGPITVGPAGITNTQDGTGNGYMLYPGASMSYAVSNLSPVYINGAAGDFVTYTGN